MNKEIEIKSILRDVVKDVESNLKGSVEVNKHIVLKRINESKVNEEDKNRMRNKVTEQTTNWGLIKYLYNSILTYEGNSVINTSINGYSFKS